MGRTTRTPHLRSCRRPACGVRHADVEQDRSHVAPRRSGEAHRHHRATLVRRLVEIPTGQWGTVLRRAATLTNWNHANATDALLGRPTPDNTNAPADTAHPIRQRQCNAHADQAPVTTCFFPVGECEQHIARTSLIASGACVGLVGLHFSWAAWCFSVGRSPAPTSWIWLLTSFFG